MSIRPDANKSYVESHTLVEQMIRLQKKISIFTDYSLIILLCSIGFLPIIYPKIFPGNSLEYFICGIGTAFIWYILYVRKREKKL
jgi:hypothetical protein